jgi:hypothetical protein
LLDGLVSGLRNLTSVKIVGKPRMADFALWAEACTLAYWPAGTFMQAYRQNIAAANEVVIEASAVGDAVRHFMAGRQTWEGTASQLLALLTPLIPEALARERSWPKTARALSGKLRRAAPPLRKVGIEIDFGRQPHTGERHIIITVRSKGVDGFASPPLPPSPKSGNARKVKGLDGDANGDANFAGDANGDDGDATVTQTAEPATVDNHRKNNGFSQKGDDGDDGDANSAVSSTSPDEPVCRRCGVPGSPVHGQLIRAGQGGAAGHYHPRCWTEEHTKGPLRRTSNGGPSREGLPPGAVFAKVEIREVWPPGLGPAGDDVFDLDPQGWRR